MEKVAVYTLYEDSVGSSCTKLNDLYIELKCAGFTNGKIDFKLYTISTFDKHLTHVNSESDISHSVHHVINASVTSGHEAFQWGTNAKFVVTTRYLVLCVFADVKCSVEINHKVKYTPHCLIIMPNSRSEKGKTTH